MKTDIDIVISAMREAGVPDDKIKVVIAELNKAAEQERASREPADRKKTQLVVLLEDPENQLAGKNFLGHVLKIEDSAAPQAALDRVYAAAKSYNDSKKGRKTPVKSVREAITIPRKHYKSENPEHRTVPQNKEPVAILVVDGSLKT